MAAIINYHRIEAAADREGQKGNSPQHAKITNVLWVCLIASVTVLVEIPSLQNILGQGVFSTIS